MTLKIITVGVSKELSIPSRLTQHHPLKHRIVRSGKLFWTFVNQYSRSIKGLMGNKPGQMARNQVCKGLAVQEKVF